MASLLKASPGKSRKEKTIVYATLANPVPEVPTGNTDRKCPTGWLAQNRLAQNRLGN